MKYEFENTQRIIGIIAFVIGMIQLIMGDMNNDLSGMIWGLVCMIIWGQSSLL